MKKIISEILIKELSVVDAPTQEGATVILIKSNQTEKAKKMDKTTKMETEQGDLPTVDSDKKVKELIDIVERLKQIISLGFAERKTYESMDMEKRENFLSSTTEQRSAITRAADESDPVVYTTLDGVAMRKSVGEAMLSMYKSNDDLRKRLDASDAIILQKNLEERVVVELPHMTGTVSDRAALLRAVDSMPEVNRVGALSALKAQNTAMAKAFEIQGVVADQRALDHSPSAKLESMAKAMADKNQDLSNEAAFSQILNTAEGQKLYADSMRK